MIYIVTALKPEAQAFVDKYKLPKSKKNSQISLFVSGIGSQNMLQTTKDIVELMSEDDIILNVGICGASKKYKIGQLIDGLKENLTCVDYEVSQNDCYEFADMESSGFLEATQGLQNRYIFKIVSDHFEPHTVTKEATKSLIFNAIEEIMKKVQE